MRWIACIVRIYVKCLWTVIYTPSCREFSIMARYEIFGRQSRELLQMYWNVLLLWQNVSTQVCMSICTCEVRMCMSVRWFVYIAVVCTEVYTVDILYECVCVFACNSTEQTNRTRSRTAFLVYEYQHLFIFTSAWAAHLTPPYTCGERPSSTPTHASHIPH